jgi:hypothetical protein
MRKPNARGKYLQLQVMVEDEGVFATLWTATMTYGSGGGLIDWAEEACAENTRGTRDERPTCRGRTNWISEQYV